MVSLPLSGIRVLDLSNVLSGPFCTYQLALLGADVLKIENPAGGDLARRLGADPQASARNMGASFVAVNAGKQSMTLNLKYEAGKEILRKLVTEADVLVENFRPGVMDRLGLGAKSLLELNPRLVYCAISGFGNDGPLAHRPAYDQIIQGMSGAMSVTGDAESAPLRVGYPVSDTVGGMNAALAICAAVLAAQRTGEGTIIDVSMLEATLSSMGWVVSNYLNAGVTPTPMGNENFTAAPSGTFVCGDGMLNIAANETKQFVALCELIGRPDLPHDARFSERNTRKRYRAELKHEIEAALAARHREQLGTTDDRRRRAGGARPKRARGDQPAATRWPRFRARTAGRRHRAARHPRGFPLCRRPGRVLKRRAHFTGPAFVRTHGCAFAASWF